MENFSSVQASPTVTWAASAATHGSAFVVVGGSTAAVAVLRVDSKVVDQGDAVVVVGASLRHLSTAVGLGLEPQANLNAAVQPKVDYC